MVLIVPNKIAITYFAYFNSKHFPEHHDESPLILLHFYIFPLLLQPVVKNLDKEISLFLPTPRRNLSPWRGHPDRTWSGSAPTLLEYGSHIKLLAGRIVQLFVCSASRAFLGVFAGRRALKCTRPFPWKVNRKRNSSDGGASGEVHTMLLLNWFRYRARVQAGGTCRGQELNWVRPNFGWGRCSSGRSSFAMGAANQEMTTANKGCHENWSKHNRRGCYMGTKNYKILTAVSRFQVDKAAKCLLSVQRCAILIKDNVFW